MAALGPVRRMLLYGITFGIIAFGATPSGGSGGIPPAPAPAIGLLVHGEGSSGREALLQPVHWGRFCRWYRNHRFCHLLVKLRQFCDRHPRHQLCDDDDDDRFCRKHPYHRRCDDKPPSPS